MAHIWLLIVDAPWRHVPAFGIVLIGLALVGRGLWFGIAGSPGLLRQARDTFSWIRCFQFAVAGLCLIAIAAAWIWRQPWLLVLGLGVLGEELLETSRILTALKREPIRPQAATKAASPPRRRRYYGETRRSGRLGYS